MNPQHFLEMIVQSFSTKGFIRKADEGDSSDQNWIGLGYQLVRCVEPMKEETLLVQCFSKDQQISARK